VTKLREDIPVGEADLDMLCRAARDEFECMSYPTDEAEQVLFASYLRRALGLLGVKCITLTHEEAVRLAEEDRLSAGCDAYHRKPE